MRAPLIAFKTGVQTGCMVQLLLQLSVNDIRECVPGGGPGLRVPASVRPEEGLRSPEDALNHDGPFFGGAPESVTPLFQSAGAQAVSVSCTVFFSM